MDYSFILRQLQVILTQNQIALIPIILIIVNLLIFIISKTFRKTGLFVLALAFGIDYAIKAMPFDLYYNVPWLYNAVTVLYILGFVLFFYKVLKMVIRTSNVSSRSKASQPSKLGQFLKFTGLLPFLIMLVINVFNYNNLIPIRTLNILTSITFFYMVVRTLISTYRFLSSKESVVLADKMDFSEIKEFLKDDNSKNSVAGSKNAGRKIRKPTVEEKSYGPTETIDINAIKDEEKLRVPGVGVKTYDSQDFSKKNDENYKLSNTELIRIISGDFDQSNNKTTMAITNLETSELISYTSSRPKFNIHQHNEYKIDLEFETINEYDYGRFIDILLKYSKNKEMYKFELIVEPHSRPKSKVIFFDPSNIYDIDDKDYVNVGGKIISMDFPKYKINFITGN